jgi:23S rRNA pseudouridine1911/1915/1917 synthase
MTHPADSSPVADRTLLEWVCLRFPDAPRTRVKEWIAHGLVTLNGTAETRAGLRMADPGAALAHRSVKSTPAAVRQKTRIHPKLALVHLDSELAIVDKVAGLLSVPDAQQRAPSALDLLADYLNAPAGDALRRRLFKTHRPIQPLPVHRLDQYTSGLLCIALTDRARIELIDQVSNHAFVRQYLAFCSGVPGADSGEWQTWLHLDESGNQHPVTAAGQNSAQQAITQFEVVERYPHQSLSQLKLTLQTGLKHQIRIQAALAGLPLLGDRRYHPGFKSGRDAHPDTWHRAIDRQALHACHLAIRHPSSGSWLKFDSPLPADMRSLETKIRHAPPPTSRPAK